MGEPCLIILMSSIWSSDFGLCIRLNIRRSKLVVPFLRQGSRLLLPYGILVPAPKRSDMFHVECLLIGLLRCITPRTAYGYEA